MGKNYSHYKKKGIESTKGHDNIVKVKKKFPKPRYKSVIQYDFLQYIRIVFKWATENHNLNRPQMELLLFLYPKGVFTRNQFAEFHRTISLYQQKTLTYFVKEGWVLQWRAQRGKESALYCLSDKGKRLCNRMHKICTGEEKIPTSPKFNHLAKDDEKRINQYYLKMIHKMNKDVE